MDQQLITLKLESLRRCLSRVVEKQPENLQQLDFKTFASQIITYVEQQED